MTAIIFIIILGILVFVHELGHFLAARLFGIRVDEFALGFPPRIFAWKPKGSETTYALNLIPFGGYVKIFGENYETEESQVGEAVNGKAEAGTVAGTVGGTVAGMAGKNTDTSRSLINQTRPKQVGVLVAGVLFNVLFAAVILSIGFMIGMPTAVDETNIAEARNPKLLITLVTPDSPAARAGLKDGDEILAVSAGEGSKAVRLAPTVIQENVKNAVAPLPLDPERVREFIFTATSSPIQFELRGVGDDGASRFINVVPEEGIVLGKKAVGIAMERIGIVSVAPHTAVLKGVVQTYHMTIDTVVGLAKFIGQAFVGEANLKQVSGPIGIAGMVGTARGLGFSYLISLTALISVNLAVLNLVPFPALDGGRILFVCIEGIRRRQISPRIANTVNLIGFALLMILMVVVTVKDVVTKWF